MVRVQGADDQPGVDRGDDEVLELARGFESESGKEGVVGEVLRVGG